MYKQLKYLIQQSETVDLDYRRTFFYILNKVRIIIRVRYKFSKFIFNRIAQFICLCKGVIFGSNIMFNGIPIIHKHPNSSIRFGNNCILNSSKNSIPIGLPQPCAFVTLKENAQIIFGNNSGASGVKIEARSTITIGNNVIIGAGCIILDSDSHHSDPFKRDQNIIPSRPITIEDNVFIGLQSTILKGVTIGKNSAIGARSVVFNDIPENCIALGNPCKVIIKRNYL